MTVTIAEFELESGQVLKEVPVAYQSWGTLNAARDNVIIVCHALTGNVQVDTWWAPLLGPGCALDTEKFFVICANVLGSCYGTAGPLSINPDTGRPYGSDFPIPTIRDTVRLHKLLLDRLGVRRVQLAIGGSMGGMQALEWAFEGDFVVNIAPIAVGGRHSAWCIAWSEAQRQAIYADPRWKEGRYDPEDPPAAGLSAARMAAMISYRSRTSFESRFGRTFVPGEEGEPMFQMESYLRYQGEKLVSRFDAVAYVRLTQSMDSHDVARGRGEYVEVLASIAQPALIIGIDSDILYPLVEQEELAQHMQNAELAVLRSPHGHDAFLIEMDILNEMISVWLQKHTVFSRSHLVDVHPLTSDL